MLPCIQRRLNYGYLNSLPVYGHGVTISGQIDRDSDSVDVSLRKTNTTLNDVSGDSSQIYRRPCVKSISTVHYQIILTRVVRLRSFREMIVHAGDASMLESTHCQLLCDSLTNR